MLLSTSSVEVFRPKNGGLNLAETNARRLYILIFFLIYRKDSKVSIKD
jgi:hypothetical protein